MPKSLPEDTVTSIWSLHKQGHSQSGISKMTGISRGQVATVLKGKPPVTARRVSPKSPIKAEDTVVVEVSRDPPGTVERTWEPEMVFE